VCLVNWSLRLLHAFFLSPKVNVYYRVQGVSGQHSSSYSLALGGPAGSRELDSMVLIGPFQLEIFYDPEITVNS